MSVLYKQYTICSLPLSPEAHCQHRRVNIGLLEYTAHWGFLANMNLCFTCLLIHTFAINFLCRCKDIFSVSFSGQSSACCWWHCEANWC